MAFLRIPSEKELDLIKASVYERDGILFWRETGKGRLLNRIAGAGPIYYGTLINGRRYLNHRIIWFLNTGKWPEQVIDHIDRNKKNNKMNNLRLSSSKANAKNKNINRRNSSGFTGVHFDKSRNKWMAWGKQGSLFKNLGRFVTKEEAINARLNFNKENGYGVS